MQAELDASRIVCRICGEVDSLPTDPAASARALAAFTAEHSIHDGFRIDVVTGPVTGPKLLQLPLQRPHAHDERARTA